VVVTKTPLGAVLFDMDGTIIDSEPYWMVAERELVESFGGTWRAEQGYALVGSGLWNTASLLRSEGVDLPHEEIIAKLSATVRAHVDAVIPLAARGERNFGRALGCWNSLCSRHDVYRSQRPSAL